MEDNKAKKHREVIRVTKTKQTSFNKSKLKQTKDF